MDVQTERVEQREGEDQATMLVRNLLEKKGCTPDVVADGLAQFQEQRSGGRPPPYVLKVSVLLFDELEFDTTITITEVPRG